MRGCPNPTGLIKRWGWHTCVSVHMPGQQEWDSGVLRWRQELVWWMRGRVIYHLQKGVHKGLEFKAGEMEGGGCGGKSPSFSLSSVPTVNFMATDHSADPRFSLALAVLSLSQTPPFMGPPETFVPFISTTNTYRCLGKEEAKRQRLCKRMLPPLNDCWFGDNLLLCKQTTCWRAQARSGFIMQCKQGQLSV